MFEKLKPDFLPMTINNLKTAYDMSLTNQPKCIMKRIRVITVINFDNLVVIFLCY